MMADMKKLFSLFVALLALPCMAADDKAPTPPTDLGKVMFVGDSITHGVNAPSWRWCFHKILADNGITYESVGYRTGNLSNGVAAGAEYGGAPFNNVHSAQSSARAWELAGRKAGGRFDNTNLLNWLGLSDKTTNGQPYTGQTWKPDTFILLIGTNDLLSDAPAGVNPDKVNGLLGADRKGGDLKTILDAMQKSSPKARIYVMTIPCWTRHANNNDAAVHQGVADYNAELAKALKGRKGAKLVDINNGLLDTTSATPFYGCEDMFNKPGADGLHPSRQGDLIMANNLANAMGLPGRTAGLARQALKSEEKGKKKELPMDKPGNAGFCAEFSTAANTSVTLADGTQGLTLYFRDGKVLYGENTVLMGNSTRKAPKSPLCRIAYTPGNEAQGVSAGFYVWLGNDLIGEALPPNAADSSYCGLRSTAPLKKAATCAESAYAPAAKNAMKKGFRLTPADPNAVVADHETKDGVLTIRKAKKAELATADAPAIVMEDGAILILGSAQSVHNIRMGNAANLTLPAAAELSIDITGAATYTIILAGGTEGMDLSKLRLLRNGQPVKAQATIPDRQAGTVVVTE